jgi:hypothetical protein
MCTRRRQLLDDVVSRTPVSAGVKCVRVAVDGADGGHAEWALDPAREQHQNDQTNQCTAEPTSTSDAAVSSAPDNTMIIKCGPEHFLPPLAADSGWPA